MIDLVINLGRLHKKKDRKQICNTCKLFCNKFWEIISDNLDLFYSVDQLIISGYGSTKKINFLAYKILGANKHPGRVFIFLTYIFRIGYLNTSINIGELILEKIYPWGQFHHDIC